MVNPGPVAVNYRRGGQDAGWLVLGLGSNVGDRESFLALARARLRDGGVPWTLASPVEETAPVGGPPEQGLYLNQLLAAPLSDVLFEPAPLLLFCQQVEREAGRVRSERWGPRTLDIDILLYGPRVIRTRDLVVPHPRLIERSFILAPLARLLPDLVHPELGLTMAGLAERACPTDARPRRMHREV
jgi:2-amino-4-hydroxy-6-hydroxymethyldihydropteridine diphosphokinase